MLRAQLVHQSAGGREWVVCETWRRETVTALAGLILAEMDGAALAQPEAILRALVAGEASQLRHVLRSAGIDVGAPEVSHA